MKKLLLAALAVLSLGSVATSAYASRDDDGEWTTWKRVNKWIVQTNSTNVCTATGDATTGTRITFAIEVDPNSRNGELYSIHIGNQDWDRVFLKGQKYWINVKIDNHLWQIDSPAVSLIDGGFSLTTDLRAAMTFAEANAIEFYYGGALLDTISLKGSYEASIETSKCIDYVKDHSQQPAGGQLPERKPAPSKPAQLKKQPSIDL